MAQTVAYRGTGSPTLAEIYDHAAVGGHREPAVAQGGEQSVLDDDRREHGPVSEAENVDALVRKRPGGTHNRIEPMLC